MTAFDDMEERLDRLDDDYDYNDPEPVDPRPAPQPISRKKLNDVHTRGLLVALGKNLMKNGLVSKAALMDTYDYSLNELAGGKDPPWRPNFISLRTEIFSEVPPVPPILKPVV